MEALDTFRSQWLPRIDAALAETIHGSSALDDAMRYSLLSPGKRLRPLLTLMAADAAGGDPALALNAACALEMVHAFSLIHDDLPCMDDDDLRRGKPTNHKVHGEAMALLAGDGLLATAFMVLRHDRCRDELSRATVRMVEGQAMDITKPKDAAQSWIDAMNTKKTGALITCAARMGGILANASVERMQSLTRYGDAVGLAFQMTDDMLDGEGGEEDRARELIAEAIDALKSFDAKADHLRLLAQSIIGRTA